MFKGYAHRCLRSPYSKRQKMSEALKRGFPMADFQHSCSSFSVAMKK